jgi:hypothetical protein
MVNSFDDLTGKSFGLMTVLKKSARGLGTTTQWECKCEGCGSIVIQRRDHLLKGKFSQCRGHVRRGKGNNTSKRPVGFSAATEVFGIYRQRARRSNRGFNLTREQFISLTSENCHYCGIPPYQIWHRTRHNGDYIYNGIDRKDSSVGYVVENCVPCCGRCNSMKSDMAEKDFLSHVKRISFYSGC